MKKRHVFLAILAVLLVLSVSIAPTIAYFTTYASGIGGYVIHLGHKTVIEDDVVGEIKQVSIFNKADSEDDVGKYPLFIRAKVYSGSDCITTPQPSDNWTQDGDYFYYGLPIYAGLTAENAKSATSILNIKVEADPDADVKPGDVIDVLVTYQSVPAVFDANGNALMSQSWSNQAAIQDING